MSTGLGGILDVSTLVSQLMTVERQPLKLLTTKQDSYKAQLSAYGTIKGDLSALQSAAGKLKLSNAFSVFKATAADATMLSATTDSTAVAGSYTVKINNLASAQTLKSADQASKTTSLGNGATTLDITVGTGTPVSVSIAANSTLEQVRNAINASSAGISATIVYNGTSYNLVYTSKETGATSTITATSADGSLAAVAASASMTQTAAAADASLAINGVAVTSTKNIVTDAIQGVTLNLTKDTGTTTVTVARDATAIEDTINKFITAYNQVVKDINFLTGKDGKLQADFSAVSVGNQLNSVLNTATGFSASGGFNYLAEVGITRGTDGNLSLNTTTFEGKLNSNFNGVVQLFTDSAKGVATSVYNQAFDMLGTTGLVKSRTDGLNSSIKDIQSRIDAFNERMDRVEKQLTKQFSSLNAMLSSMNQTMTYLSQQFG